MSLAALHGTFNLVTGLWAPLHRRSFEAVTGPKLDYWLVNTVAGLLVTNGLVQLTAPTTSEGHAMARRLGIGTAGTLVTIDVVYGVKGRISPVYLLDALVELAWITAWAIQSPPRPQHLRQ
jgi:hypothetical protein